VTHDQEEAMSIADRIVVMNQGRIEDQGPPDRIYLKPATLFTATFMGESNILEGRVVARAEGCVHVTTPLGTFPVSAEAPPGDLLHLSIRPEHIRPGEAPAGACALPPATLREIVFQGTHLRIHARTEAGIELMLRWPAGAGAAVGERLPLHANLADIVAIAG